VPPNLQDLGAQKKPLHNKGSKKMSQALGVQKKPLHNKGSSKMSQALGVQKKPLHNKGSSKMSQALGVQKKPLHKSTSKSPMGPTSTPPHVGPYSSNAHGCTRARLKFSQTLGAQIALRAAKSPKGCVQPAC
jgi:hypothetical protein